MIDMMKSSLPALLCLLLFADAARGQVLNIDSCYAMALRNYPLIRQYSLIDKTKEYTLSNAGKAYLPQLSINAIEGYVFGQLPSFGGSGSSGGFKFIGIGQVSQTLWDGGATKTQKEIATASAETEKASTDVSLYDLHQRINQLYFGVLLIDEQLKQLDIQNSVLANNINRARQLHEQGLAYSTDVDEVKAEQLKLHQQKTEFIYSRSGYLMMLSLLTGARLSNDASLQKPFANILSAYSAILRPELTLYKNQRTLVDAQSHMQHVSLMPKIGLIGAGVIFAPGISFGNSTLSSLGVAGLSASWNIGGLYKNSNDKQLTQQQLSKISVQEETFLFNTRLQMTQSAANINKQKAILSEDDEIVQLRQNIRQGYQLKYDNGAGPLMDLLNAAEKEKEARAQKALHEMQWLMSLYDYKTITGHQ